MRFFRKLRTLLHKNRLDADMADEMRMHVELQAERNLAAGMSPDEARYAAQRAFGGVEQIKERCRDQRGLVWLEHVGRDLRFAFASLRKNPAFTLAAVFTLVVGLGATTTIFTIIDAVVWRPLPYAEPGRLVTHWGFSPATLRIWEEEQAVVDRIETHRPRGMVLSSDTEPRQVMADAVSPGLFGLLGRMPALGHPFAEIHAETGNHRVAVVSHAFWQSHFGGDPAVVGRELVLDDEPYTVIGVMPRGFGFPRPNIALWLPLRRPQSDADQNERVEMIGRLRPGVSLAAAKEVAKSLNERLNQAHPQPRGWNVSLAGLDDSRVNPGPRKMMLMFLGAVGFVLLIACTNVANLLLVRAAVRQREFAMRVALGAGGGRLIQQVLTESLVLVAGGAAGGLLFAQWAVRTLWLAAPRELTFLTINEVRMDWRVFAFTTAVVAVVTLLCGALPALRVARTDANQAAGLGSRAATPSRRQQRWQHGFVIAQSALAFVLLVGAGLLMRGFLRLNAVDPGFDLRGLSALSIQLPVQRYPSAVHRQNFFEQLRERVAAVPGVTEMAFAVGIPPQSGGFGMSVEIEIEGRAPDKLGASEWLPFNKVDDDYFRTLRIPLLRGRGFGPQDVAGGPPSIIINDQMARRFWGDTDPIGQRVRFNPRQAWLTIVGVVGDVKAMNLSDQNGDLEYYRPVRQEGYGGYMTLAIRTAGEAEPALPAIRQQLLALDPKLPIASLATARALMAETLATPRFCLALMAVFAAVALFLAAIGLYGVMSYTVAQRTQEIGVRIALGGTPGDIVRVVAGRGLALTAIGLALGAVAAVPLTQFLETMLFEVSALDPATFATVAVLLASAGAGACWLPARRAAKVDPMAALRAE